MDHFPIFVATSGRRIVLSGGGDAALAKLRLLLKTDANITVFSPTPATEIVQWAATGKLTVVKRAMEPGDAMCAVLFYAADEDAVEDKGALYVMAYVLTQCHHGPWLMDR